MGQTFQDGRRTLGDGKTFRGTIAGTACGILAGLLQNQIAPMIRPAVLWHRIRATARSCGPLPGSDAGRHCGCLLQAPHGAEARCASFCDRPDRLCHWSLAAHHNPRAAMVLAKLHPIDNVDCVDNNPHSAPRHQYHWLQDRSEERTLVSAPLAAAAIEIFSTPAIAKAL